MSSSSSSSLTSDSSLSDSSSDHEERASLPWLARYAEYLERAVRAGNTEWSANSTKYQIDEYFVKVKPSISIGDYLERIDRFVLCEENTWILSIIYVDRFVHYRRSAQNYFFLLCDFNVHLILAMSILTAVKVHQEIDRHRHPHHTTFAKIFGISSERLNCLERLFLSWMQWDLQVLPEQFEQYATAIRSTL